MYASVRLRLNTVTLAFGYKILGVQSERSEFYEKA